MRPTDPTTVPSLTQLYGRGNAEWNQIYDWMHIPRVRAQISHSMLMPESMYVCVNAAVTAVARVPLLNPLHYFVGGEEGMVIQMTADSHRIE